MYGEFPVAPAWISCLAGAAFSSSLVPCLLLGKMASKEAIAAVLLATGVEEAMKNIPNYCQTEELKEKVVQQETPLAAKKAEKIWQAWGWLPTNAAAEDVVHMDVERSQELKTFVEKAWVQCWEKLPEVAKEHLVMAEVKEEWLQKECVGLVKERLAQPPVYRFEPEVPPSTEGDEAMLTGVDAAVAKVFLETLEQRCAEVEEILPEYLRSPDMKKKIREENYWPTLRDILVHQPGQSLQKADSMSEQPASQNSEESTKTMRKKGLQGEERSYLVSGEGERKRTDVIWCIVYKFEMIYLRAVAMKSNPTWQICCLWYGRSLSSHLRAKKQRQR